MQQTIKSQKHIEEEQEKQLTEYEKYIQKRDNKVKKIIEQKIVSQNAKSSEKEQSSIRSKHLHAKEKLKKIKTTSLEEYDDYLKQIFLKKQYKSIKKYVYWHSRLVPFNLFKLLTEKLILNLPLFNTHFNNLKNYDTIYFSQLEKKSQELIDQDNDSVSPKSQKQIEEKYQKQYSSESKNSLKRKCSIILEVQEELEDHTNNSNNNDIIDDLLIGDEGIKQVPNKFIPQIQIQKQQQKIFLKNQKKQHIQQE